MIAVHYNYYPEGKRWWVRLHEKGGKEHAMPTHHNLEAWMDAYLHAAGIADQKKSPLFRTTPGRTGILTADGMTRVDAWRMIRRRARAAGIDVITTLNIQHIESLNGTVGTITGVAVRETVAEGRWIRPAGLDFTAGETLLEQGRKLTARDIGLAAAATLVLELLDESIRTPDDLVSKVGLTVIGFDSSRD